MKESLSPPPNKSDPSVNTYSWLNIAQIVFEFIYLLVLFAGIIYCFVYQLKIDTKDTFELFKWSFIGGFSGGWLIDAKWLYTVTAHGRKNQKSFKWESKKIIWRLLYPFCAGLFSLSMYIVSISGIVFLFSISHNSYSAAFGLSFIIGCFYDDIIRIVHKWLRGMFSLQMTNKFEDQDDNKENK